MAYFVISQFGAGVDTRSPVFASDPGTLYLGKNVHLTSAGHIEVRKEFVLSSTLPAGTFGLAGLGEDRYVFGSIAEPAGLPSGVFYQQLAHPTGAVMTATLDIELFDGNFYVIGEYTNDIVHFYDTVRVADWLVAGEVDADAFIGGRSAKTLGEKIYVTAGANLHFSATTDPTKFKTAEVGAGFINMSTHSSSADDLVAAELYYENLAVFAGDSAQVWNMASDPTENRRAQTLRGTGLVAPRAAISYLDGDTFFLSYQGVRTLQPRDSSGRSGAKPASAQINRELVAHLKDLTPDVLDKAQMLVEPEENRLWVILGTRIYVLNWFPENNIKGWTEYELDFEVDWAVVVDRRVWLRSGDDLYLYGGVNDDEYYAGDGARARLPYVDMRAPATYKGLFAFDAGVEGTWELYAGQRPDEQEVWERVGIIADQTYDKPAHPITGSTSHVSIEVRHQPINERALLSAVALHYKSNESS